MVHFFQKIQCNLKSNGALRIFEPGISNKQDAFVAHA